MTPRRTATLVEVARRAGVSLTTASKAINHQDRISEATRARVMKAARELSYVPNQNARSLITGRTRTVGVIVIDSLSHRFGVPIMIGAENALAATDLSMIISDAGGDAGRCRDLARMLSRRRVDGIIVIGDDNHLTPSVTRLVDVPVVYVYGRSERASDTMRLPDDRAGGVLVAHHLLDLGRTRIAHLTGPRGSTAVQERVDGIRESLQASSRRIVGGVHYGSWSQRWGRTATQRLLAKTPGVDAVIAGSDQIAAGVVTALMEAGRRIPDDVAVTGYDNWDIFALETEPPLTTVQTDLEGMGTAAAQELFAVMDGSSGRGGVELLDPRLIVRASTVASGHRDDRLRRQ